MSATAPTKNSAFIDSIINTGHLVSGFDKLRTDGLNKLQTSPFPTLRNEVWKYTRVSGMLKKSFSSNTAEITELPSHLKSIIQDHPHLVFVNGKFNDTLSILPDTSGIKVEALSSGCISQNNTESFPTHWEEENEAFTHLNAASFTDGAFIEINENVKLDTPIYLVHLSLNENTSVSKRNFVQVKEGAELTVINLFNGDDEISFTNHFNSIQVAENSHLNWFDYHQDGIAAHQVNTTIVNQLGNSTLNIGSYIFGGKLIRKNFYINILGQNAETTANGTYILNEKQVADHRLILDHKAAHCNSNQTFKGVMGDKSSGIFNGKIYVREDSQIINAFQSNRNILLSDDANAYSRPQLEIYADDVKCSHGSTIGQLDDEALFYLMARGIRRTEAEKLLVSAFTADAMENISFEPFKEVVLNAVAEKSAKL
jgi:Fe-S cluster assembly protein SufD